MLRGAWWARKGEATYLSELAGALLDTHVVGIGSRIFIPPSAVVRCLLQGVRSVLRAGDRHEAVELYRL